MKKIEPQADRIIWISGVLSGLLLSFLMLFRLGTLTKGFSAVEVRAATTPVGWHGLYNSPLYLPLKLVRSVDFYLFKTHGEFLTRLPDVFFGILTIISFYLLIYLWHGRRTATMSTVIFAFGAWTLHVSRLASYDILYYWSMTSLILVHTLLKKKEDYKYCWYYAVVIWCALLTIPGMVWLVLLSLYLERDNIKAFWYELDEVAERSFNVVLPFLTFLILALALHRPGQLKLWLGLPTHLESITRFAKEFVGVFVHLFIRGPEYPSLWLGRAPLLDAFCLGLALIGVYFYARHVSSSRVRLLVPFAIISGLLIALGGPVGFSLVVPIIYIMVATGIAFLLHEWFNVFPHNPLARSLGYGLLCLAITLSCVYNLRAYFVAWPKNTATKATFSITR